MQKREMEKRKKFQKLEKEGSTKGNFKSRIYNLITSKQFSIKRKKDKSEKSSKNSNFRKNSFFPKNEKKINISKSRKNRSRLSSFDQAVLKFQEKRQKAEEYERTKSMAAQVRKILKGFC